MSILITGANRGIGAALLSVYSSQGHTVLGTSRGQDDLLDLDVTDPRSLQALSTQLDGKPITNLICNSGVLFDKFWSIDGDYDADLWAKTFAVNVTGVFETITTLLPNLRAAKGKIAILSSQMGSSTRAGGDSYAYRASKAAVLNIGRNLAVDLRADGIAVGIYHPGWVRTDMGGAEADVSVEDSAAGLVKRFEALSIETTGCFEDWQGEAMPF